MLVTIVLAISISSAVLISVLIDLVKKTQYFAEAIRVYQSVQLPDTPRSKGDIRRLRKYRFLYRVARRRILLLFTVQVSVFALIYTLMVFTVATITRSSGIVSIPISIPFLSYIEDGGYKTHIYVVALVGFAIPLYLVSRSVRLEQ